MALAVDPGEALSVQTVISGDSALLTLTGELDLSMAARLMEAVENCLESAAPRVVGIDMSRVSFCDCAGFTTLLRARKRVAASGGDARLLNPSPAVTRLLTLLERSNALPAGARPPETTTGDSGPQR